MKLSCLKYYLLLFFVIASNNTLAQYSPYFKNYSLSEYNAGNQNWDISLSDNGKLYVANNNGLLEFDGVKWILYELPNKTTIRSVFAYKDKVYTGSYEEFGYWQNNDKGILTYTSLNHLFNLDESLNEEFWQTTKFNDTIVIRSFLNIYLLKNNSVTKVKTPSTVISCDVVDKTLYVSTLRHGIFTLEGSSLIPFFDNDTLEGTFNGFHFDEPVTRRIDYIFISKIEVNKYAVLSDNWDCKYPSDHLPIFIEFKLTKN